MKKRHIVLQNKSSKKISFSRLSEVAHALQVQIDRDFGPVWGVSAQVVALGPSEIVPKTAWPITIVNKPVGGLGIHLDKNGRPFAQVKDTLDWTVTASHELLEMLVDPLGHRFVSAPDIDPEVSKHNVFYLVEVADPCEMYTYSINGVDVSDFVTPDYYDVTPSSGAVFDFAGRLDSPLEVPNGGYLSWIDPADGRWHQKTPDGVFVNAKGKVDVNANPRDDRDAKLPEAAGADRHDTARVRTERVREFV